MSDRHDAQIVRLYDTIFDRLPAETEVKWWGDALRSGYNPARLADEFVVHTLAQTTKEFVQQLYRYSFGWEATAAEVDWWAFNLDTGLARRGDTAVGFANDAYHVRLVEEGRAQPAPAPKPSPTPINGTEGSERLDGTPGDDQIFGLGGNDVIFGDGFAPGIAGQDRDPDQYIGGGDKIRGGDGDDWISGGHGADWLWGGDGADRFVIGSHVPMNPDNITPGMYVLDTGVGEGARDVIFDFVQGEDKIDLSQLLSLNHRHLNINDAYEFIGARGFTGARPQVRYEFEGDRTVVRLDGANYSNRGVDGLVDAEIELHGRIPLLDTDFLL